MKTMLCLLCCFLFVCLGCNQIRGINNESAGKSMSPDWLKYRSEISETYIKGHLKTENAWMVGKAMYGITEQSADATKIELVNIETLDTIYDYVVYEGYYKFSVSPGEYHMDIAHPNFDGHIDTTFLLKPGEVRITNLILWNEKR